VDRARDAAIDVYQRLRRVAGLDAQPARVVSLERASRKGKSRHPKQRLDVTLMNEATRVLNSESYFEWAVVLAQTACEVYARDILERRAARLGDVAIDSVARLPGTNLANQSVRRTFCEITGYTSPDETEWWREYQAHAQRRHRIVHDGARITRQDAEDSIEAAKTMIAFLHWTSASIDAERKVTRPLCPHARLSGALTSADWRCARIAIGLPTEVISSQPDDGALTRQRGARYRATRRPPRPAEPPARGRGQRGTSRQPSPAPRRPRAAPRWR
jgi:hypothetical protein